MKTIYISILLISISIITHAQTNSPLQQTESSASLEDLLAGDEDTNTPVIASFKASRIISAQSNESVKKHELHFEISHRFGDIGGDYGGSRTFYGLDNASDIKIAFDYGVSNKFAIGIARVKGATAIRQLVELNGKYKLIQQTTNNKIPLGITLYGNGIITAMQSNIKTNVPDYFESKSDRMSFMVQGIVVRKFSPSFSLAILPTLVHYDKVLIGDQRNTFALGGGGRLKFTKRMAIIADYFYTFKSKSTIDYYSKNGLKYYNHLGLGFEIETGGHVFQLCFMNSTALLENQFIPYTTTNWLDGQFRWGFSFGRTFTLGFSNRNKHDA